METKKVASPRGARKVTLWDTRNMCETVVYYGYQTPTVKPRETRKGIVSLSMFLRLREKKPEISIHEVNETQKGINSLFKSDIPEINTLTLYPKYPETFKVEIGDCEKQRRIFPYRKRAKNKTRRIKKRESPPLTLNNLRFNPKFNYTISFKCPLCNNHQTMRIRNHNLKRETPICKEHKQRMFIAKVTKKRNPRSRKLSMPKIIYEVDHS